jgi:hypothetical protein
VDWDGDVAASPPQAAIVSSVADAKTDRTVLFKLRIDFSPFHFNVRNFSTRRRSLCGVAGYEYKYNIAM